MIARVVGNPVTFLVDQSTATNEEIEAIKERFGLNDSIPRQYVNFVWEIAQLDFGHSFRGTSTIDAIGDRAVNTFKLGAAALVFALALGIPLGIIAALKRGSPVDWIARTLAVIGQATPNFWLGLMMIFFFAVEPQLVSRPPARTAGRALILPAISLGHAGDARRVHAGDPLRADRRAWPPTSSARRAPRACSERTVIWRHAMRHALLPVVTILGISLWGLIERGSVIVEDGVRLAGDGAG